MELIHKFVHFGSNGEEAYLTIEKLWDGVYYLDRSTPGKNLVDVAPGVWESLVMQAIDCGSQLRAAEIQFRTVSNQDSIAFINWVTQTGFQRKQDRIEFRALIHELADGSAGPIAWKPVELLSDDNLKWIGDLIHQVSAGDPGYDPKEDPIALLKCYLGDPALTSGPGCIHLGSLEGRVMSLVIAQVNPKSGWSRITYMGMLPEFRGRGLGKWVHRHGFEMMREQGGKLYQGGTASTNERMLKLFQLNGCKEYRRMQEWTYKF